MPDSNVNISIPKAWLAAFNTYVLPLLVTSMLGGEGYLLWNRLEEEQVPGSEKAAITVRCDLETGECVYRDEYGHTHPAKREFGDEGEWVYSRAGEWYYVSDRTPVY